MNLQEAKRTISEQLKTIGRLSADVIEAKTEATRWKREVSKTRKKVAELEDDIRAAVDETEMEHKGSLMAALRNHVWNDADDAERYRLEKGE